MAHFLWLVFLAFALAGLSGAFVYQLVSLWQERARRAQRARPPIIRSGRR